MLYLIKAFLPHLLSRPQAQIFNISSMGGFLAVPGQSVYCASKAAVKILSESLASELAKTNVHITTVLPGAIFTDIKTNSGLGKEAGVSASDYKTAPKGTLSPSVAVKAIIESVEQGKSSVCIGKDSKVMNIFYRLNPTFACGLINKKMKAHVA
jgi:short-subunit dehydrogenase